MSGHPMDDRREYVATTLVYSDRHGPQEFWRGGVQVPCICDPDHGITCAYHGRAEEDRQQSPRPPEKPRRRPR